MKKYLVVLFTLTLLSSFIAGVENVVKLTEINKPGNIVVDGGQILISEFPVVYVYSQKDFRFITKFGKSGEGPREFNQYIRIQKDPENPDKIVIGSHLKISYYSRDGKFISEKRPKGAGFANVYKPFGKNFVSYGGYQDKEKKINYATVELYDSNMKKIKQVYKEPQFFQQGRKLNPLRTWGAWFRLYKDQIFITGEKEGYVMIYDYNGDKSGEIKVVLDKLNVRGSDEKRYHEFFRTDPQMRNFYEQFKQQIEFPSSFPVIRGMDVVDDKLYVNGYQNPDGKTEFAVYDLKGNLLKSKVYLIIPEATARDLYPYTIKDGKVYQLVDDVDEEIWELRIHDLK